MLSSRCFEGARLQSRHNCYYCIAALAAEGMFPAHEDFFSTLFSIAAKSQKK
jgi:hypothetical protein